MPVYPIQNTITRLNTLKTNFFNDVGESFTEDPFIDFFSDINGPNASAKYAQMVSFMEEFLDTALPIALQAPDGTKLTGVTRRDIGARIMLLDPVSNVIYDSAKDNNTYADAIAGKINENHSTREDVARIKIVPTMPFTTITTTSPTSAGAIRHYVTTRHSSDTINSLYYSRISFLASTVVSTD